MHWDDFLQRKFSLLVKIQENSLILPLEGFFWTSCAHSIIVIYIYILNSFVNSHFYQAQFFSYVPHHWGALGQLLGRFETLA